MNKQGFPKRGVKKKNQQLILNISWFLLTKEDLKSLIWNIKSIDYNPAAQILKIGISAQDSKLGTTLGKLRKHSRDLSDYLYQTGLTFRCAKIQFFVDKKDVEIEKIYNLIDSIKLT